MDFQDGYISLTVSEAENHFIIFRRHLHFIWCDLSIAFAHFSIRLLTFSLLFLGLFIVHKKT